MNPDRGIVRTYRRSDGLSMRPDDHNTLTFQSVNKNGAPREPLYGLVISQIRNSLTRAYAVTILNSITYFLYSHNFINDILIKTKLNVFHYQQHKPRRLLI